MSVAMWSRRRSMITSSCRSNRLMRRWLRCNSFSAMGCRCSLAPADGVRDAVLGFAGLAVGGGAGGQVLGLAVGVSAGLVLSALVVGVYAGLVLSALVVGVYAGLVLSALVVGV